MSSPADTRATSIAKKLDPLIDWFLKNKPENKTVRLWKKDFLWLKEGDPAIRVKGFCITGETITYRGFSILPFES